MVFGAPELAEKPEVFEELFRKYPTSVLLGCSTSGEIFHDRITDQSLSVGIVKFEHTRLGLAQAQVSSPEDSFFAGQDIGSQLYKPGLKAVFVLSEGVHINGSEVVRGMNSILPETIVVTGGLAGDGD